MYATSRRIESMTGFTQPNIEKLALDVTDDAAVTTTVNEVFRREGQIDILVNCAGRSAIGGVYCFSVLDTLESMPSRCGHRLAHLASQEHV